MGSEWSNWVPEGEKKKQDSLAYRMYATSREGFRQALAMYMEAMKKKRKMLDAARDRDWPFRTYQEQFGPAKTEEDPDNWWRAPKAFLGEGPGAIDVSQKYWAPDKYLPGDIPREGPWQYEGSGKAGIPKINLTR